METGVIPIFPRVTHRAGVKIPLQIENSQGFARNLPILGESYKDYKGLTENKSKLQLNGKNPVAVPLSVHCKDSILRQLIGKGDFVTLPGLI